MDNHRAKAFLDREIPLQARAALVSAVHRAYEIVERCYDQVDFLKRRLGRDLRGDLRRVAVDFELQRLVEAGKLPFQCRIAPNASDTCRHLELHTKRCIVTASQVPTVRSVPRGAIFRTNLSLNPQLHFDLDSKGLCAPKVSTERRYLLLTHGSSGTTPDFVCLGIPGELVDGWIYRTNLMGLLHQVAVLGADVEDITEETLVKFRKRLKEEK